MLSISSRARRSQHLLVLGGLSLVAALAVLMSGSATAAIPSSATLTSATTSAVTAPSPATVQVTIASSGKVLTLPANWQSLTPDQLKPYGLVPNIPPPGGLTSTGGTVAPSAGGVVPMSAAGCSGLVCIILVGKGLVVNRWETHTLPIGWSTCTFAAFWSNGIIFLTGAEMCSGSGAQYYWYVNNVVFTRRSTVCNTWVGIGGKPCETVHP